MDFLGEFQHKLDSKKRLFIPAKYRGALADGFIVSKAPDHCLYIYSKEEWEPVAAQIKSLPGSEEYRRFKRDFFRNADLAEMDSQGRFTVKADLLEYAGLDKEVLIIGSGNKFEVWDADSVKKDTDKTLSADELGIEVVF
ncbi:MAG: division/cell wall cluster transcriptional repressor MraZ [Clostridia bacterium]|nr:division/cell wall cluster transcriptional repressor MraZ [Clostridia bacterium]MBR1705094.1 division/cell wall cluster transcriptional repressor MraZ [Clostridia bacterium]